MILEALANAEPIVRHFPSDDVGKESTIATGVLASPSLTVEGEVVSLFFRREHKAAREEKGCHTPDKNTDGPVETKTDS